MVYRDTFQEIRFYRLGNEEESGQESIPPPLLNDHIPCAHVVVSIKKEIPNYVNLHAYLVYNM